MKKERTGNMELIKRFARRYAEKKANLAESERKWSEEIDGNKRCANKPKENYRKICEKKIRRKLCPGEHVHHLNSNHEDNRPDNLEPLALYEHGSKHGHKWH